MKLGSDVSQIVDHRGDRRGAGPVDRRSALQRSRRSRPLHERLCGLARTLRQRHALGCEVVYVDDGSADATLAIARGLPADALDVQVVSLSRNFGKEAALMAGLDHARRGAVLFMDGDGQHPPDLVEKLVKYWIEDGYDVVYTAKANRDQ